jgi:hypothetical protein
MCRQQYRGKQRRRVARAVATKASACSGRHVRFTKEKVSFVKERLRAKRRTAQT